jgi:hypothetical protein
MELSYTEYMRAPIITWYTEMFCTSGDPIPLTFQGRTLLEGILAKADEFINSSTFIEGRIPGTGEPSVMATNPEGIRRLYVAKDYEV